MAEWASNTDWGIRPPFHYDALRLNVPQDLVSTLKDTGGVDEFLMYVGDVGENVSAIMRSGSGHREYMLIVNVPAWLQLAPEVAYQALFERQIRSVIQHEMAHFRHVETEERAETHAHCRGIASVLANDDYCWGLEQIRVLIETEYPEFTHNEEIQRLILNGSSATLRLIRFWHWLFATTRTSRTK